jgi:PadR family transcriptional regulator PadR
MELTAIEQQVMLAIQRLHPSGYGVSIQQELRKRTGKELAFGTIYASLERLEEKGMVTSRQGEATAQRGGRRKFYFTLTAIGQRSLQASLVALDTLRRGIRWQEVTDVA